MATLLAESQEIDRFLVPSSEIRDGFVPESVNERSLVPFSHMESSDNQSLASSLINPNTTDTPDSDPRPILPREEAEQSPSLPISLLIDNSSNGSSFEWCSSEDCGSFSPNSIDFQETKSLIAGAGLANLGNTCFINAILQCFTHTAPFVEGLRGVNHSMPCDGFNESFCVLCAIRHHIELSLTTPGGVISPAGLVNNLSYFSSYFRRYQQEDAHEFMQCFLDKLERCLKSGEGDKISSEDDGLVNKVFGGRLLSKLGCCNCGHCSETYEPLVDLSLEIEDVDSLSSALESFTKVEKIEDPEAKFKCEDCQEEVSVEKQLKLEKIPLVVTFHLKRFKTDGSYVEKIDKHVEFPLELDLQPYSMGSQDVNGDEFKYELYAIVEHTGFSLSSGHYFSFVRSSPDTWYRMDDSKVTRVSEDYVLSQEAYILLYKRKGTSWISNLLEPRNCCLNSDSNLSPKSVLVNIDNGNLSRPAESKASCEAAPAPPDAVEFDHALLSGEMGDKERGVNDLENVSSTNLHTVQSVATKSSRVGYDDVFLPLTPPRSPSPDIDFFRTPEPQYQIPRDHLKIEKCTTPGRSVNKALDGSERKAALRYIKKSMPSSRGSKMIAAIFGSQSEGSSLSKKRRMSSHCKRSSPPNNRRKTGLIL